MIRLQRVFMPVMLLMHLTATSDIYAASGQGEAIATRGAGSAPACSVCHAMNEQGRTSGVYPRLAGQPQHYLEKQIREFKTGKRTHAIMAPIAKGLDETQIADVAAYYAAIKVRVAEQPAAATMTLGASLAKRGKWSVDVPACNACHGPNGQGIPPHFPALAGQPAAYISGQLDAWRSETRKNDPLGLMQSVAMRLSNEDIQAISTYYQNLQIRGSE